MPPGTVLLLLVATAVSPPLTGGEVAEVCTEDILNFSCHEEGTQLAIKEAWLYGATSTTRDEYDGEEEWAECHVPEYNLQYQTGSFLSYINKQCGGQYNCSFDVRSHVPAAGQYWDRWKEGTLWVSYECVKLSSFHRVCSTEMREQEGWLRNVGYPQYYLEEPTGCTLTITVDKGQQIRLTITDLSIRDVIQPNEARCRDSLKVSEGSKELLVRCGDINRPLTVTSEGPSLSVTLTAASSVFPKRGFVANYQALGCETPEIPHDGYLSYRNTTHAEFWCCIRHIFFDTLSRHRTLQCVNRLTTWNDTLPECHDLDDLLANGNITEYQYHALINGSSSMAQAEMLQQAHFVYDLVVPAVIMTVLVLGNVAVVFLIIYCRKGVIEEGVRCEELESIKANPEPTDTIDSKPCNV